jgi:methyl-accepting chemotaxis protein
MPTLRSLPVRRKFFLTFGLICLFCFVLGLFSFLSFRSLAAKTKQVSSNSLPAIVQINELSLCLRDIRREDQNLVLCTDQSCIQTHVDRRLKAIAAFAAALDAYRPYASTLAAQNQLDTIVSASQQLYRISNESNRLLLAGNTQQASALLMAPETFRIFDGTKNAIAEVLKSTVQNGIGDSNLATRSSQRAIWIDIAVTLFILFLAFTIALLLTRAIVPPLVEVTDALESLANKDLTVSVPVTRNDEIGRLCNALNICSRSMRDMVNHVGHSGNVLAHAAQELSVRSTQIAQNAATQKGRVQQISTAATEMTATIGEISQNATHASSASRDSAHTAHQSGEVIQTATNVMSQIASQSTELAGKMETLGHRSQEIGAIVQVIQEISEQTNLLALNASIEAARAGEQGRGFAVVAGEVRRLAERTRSATEEIGSTIRSIQQDTLQTLDAMTESRSQVETGLRTTADAQSSLAILIGLSSDVENMINLIATAATEQTAASGEISDATALLSRLTIENAQGAAHSASDCQKLTELAVSLEQMIGQFRLEK